MKLTTYSWPVWKKFCFCFLFIYISYSIAPWYWFSELSLVSKVIGVWDKWEDQFVRYINSHVFHLWPDLVYPNGSGDTSWAWTQLCIMLCLSLILSSIWVLFFRKRTNFNKLDHWLVLFIRYSLSKALFSYGIIKLFAMQMVFPNQSQMATSLGDYLPMRFSWLFIGYSTPYQVFSGAMEVIAGLLLLWRKTATFGVLLAIAVFTNVFMLNMAYDIPVKLYSLHLLLFSILLSIHDCRRIINFFINSQSTQASTLYDYDYGSSPWLKYGRWIMKSLIIFLVTVPVINEANKYYKEFHAPIQNTIVANGHYEVMKYSKNGTQVPYSPLDTLTWKNIILEGKDGSLISKDSLFRQRYGRGYFAYTIDTIQSLINMKKRATDSLPAISLNFNILDSIHLHLSGLLKGDSIAIDLIKVNRHFPLEERQFHWLSEYNR